MKLPYLLPLVSCLLLLSCNGREGEGTQHGLIQPDSTGECAHSANFRQESFERTFKGKLNGQYPITMRLVSEDGMELTGSYSYDGKMGGSYQLSGSLELDGAFNLIEKDENGTLRSTFQGYFYDRHWMEGTWSSAEGEEPLPFLLGDGYNSFNGSRVDSVRGYKGVFVHSRSVCVEECKCLLRIEYPQLLGVATPEIQEAANRAIRFSMYQNMDATRLSSCACRLSGNYSFGATYLTGDYFSGYISDSDHGEFSTALVVNLATGELLSNDQLIRDQNGLEAYLRTLYMSMGDGNKDILIWFTREGIHLETDYGDLTVIPWSHPQLHTWFRNLPPSV